MGDSGTTRGALGRHPVRTVVVLAALALAALAARLAAPGSDAAGLLLVLACLAPLPFAFWSVRWLWRKLTYRVGVRLFISYLLVGLTPFFLMAILAAAAAWIAVGQYGSVRLGAELTSLGERLSARASSAERDLGASGSGSAAAQLGDPPGTVGPRAAWVLAQGSKAWRSEGGDGLAVPTWAPEGSWRGTVVVGRALGMAAIERRADAIAAVLVPLDAANAPMVVGSRWVQARFVNSGALARAGKTPGGVTTVTISQGEPGRGGTVRIGAEPVPPEQVEPGWLATAGTNAGATGGAEAGDRWDRMRVVWARVLERPRNWSDGRPAKDSTAVAVMKVSLGGAADDFFAGPKRMGGEVRSVLTVAAALFGSMYLIAVSFAVVMIVSVARSTARLTRGARAVARGDLDQRIPVKRHDQLGDLATSFNAMTASVAAMLVEVAEKERMAHEMELAREIQSSLLPPSELSSGPLSVWAHFRPAAEVGGDYFDLFPLAPGRLVVTVGDVAGHGLHTGLLMAMVKSGVATLVEEGHSGRALLERLNRLLLGQPIKQRMVSLAVAEIDVARAEVEITSAGHQPAMVLGVDGRAEEVLLASLPLGHPWPDPAPARTLPFGPGSRLVLYSDGLVEARDAEGVPFGHDRLRDALLANRKSPARDLVGILLAELERHTSGQPLADDLTVVVVEHLAPAA